jgi:hypothetical protein
LIIVPIGYGIYDNWEFWDGVNNKNDVNVIAVFVVLSLTIGFTVFFVRIANCWDCNKTDCILSLYCDLYTKIKRVKRLFIFLGYDKEKVNNIATINYQCHNNYIDIIEITYKKLTEQNINYKGYND